MLGTEKHTRGSHMDAQPHAQKSRETESQGDIFHHAEQV